MTSPNFSNLKQAWFGSLAAMILGLLGLSSTAAGEPNLKTDLRGWHSLVDRLKKDGLPEDMLHAIYSDSRMPPREWIPFKVKPREHASSYKKFYDPGKIKRARSYLQDHARIFARVKSEFKIDPALIAALHLIETELGAFVGNNLIINRLSRLCVLSEPDNILWNFSELKKSGKDHTIEQVSSRAAYLDQTFYPQLLAFFNYAAANSLDPLYFKGSSAGAMGIPQFMPISVLRYGIDGDEDGKVDIFQFDDAILSTANYLADHGWNDSLTMQGKIAVLLRYNQSPPYAEAVLKVADLIH